MTVRRRRGFTLIELLIVIAIIGVLATLLLTAISVAQRKAKSAQISSQLSNIDLAVNAYHQDEGFYPGIGFANPAYAVVDDTEMAQLLYKALRNRASATAGGGRSFPYHDPGQLGVGVPKATAGDNTTPAAATGVSGLPNGGANVPQNANSDPLPAGEASQLDIQTYQVGNGIDNMFVDAQGNYFHYREWETRSEGDKTAAGAVRNRSRFDLWSNGANGRNQSFNFYENLDTNGDLVEDQTAGGTGQGGGTQANDGTTIRAEMDDLANFDR